MEQQAKLLLPDTSQEIILYCRTGSRSFEAANILLALGYTKVYDLGSISDWCCELEK
ncbi:MAG: rhodanese-like domain-containing protein [Oscillospiraceae bacterium]|nr:rhodanese-like domain-containing protein [Oscillospiraceae bacterium]